MNKSTHSTSPAQADRLFIVALTPLILEKGLIWFEKNQRRIEKSINKPSFWQRNTIMLEKNQTMIMSELLRKLTDFGYQKYQHVELPGEFSQIGGTVTIFPINADKAFKIEFLGNTVEEIRETHIENSEAEKPLKKIIYTEKGRRRKISNDLSNLKKGDYIVHLDHGIGRFLGSEKSEIRSTTQSYDGSPHRMIGAKSVLDSEGRALPFEGPEALSGLEGRLGLERETNPNYQNSNNKTTNYYVLEYAADDKLRVPETVAHKLSPYIGFSTPAVYRLGGNLWHRTKRKVREDIIKTAKELLRLYAEREIVKRPPYAQKDDMQSQVSHDFEFEETPDQQKAMEEIISDMEKETPMDRLVCGDVGFGKTELAVRAAAKAAVSGRQTAIIAPTTILTWQHLKTLEARFAKLPISIGLLSRVQKNNEQKYITKKLKRGEIDILIGTHRILQKDVAFKNLGLLIIDEEQRFGVKQKEKLKKMRAHLDVLSLSATPIPRTLYFSLSGLKNISNIQTPPSGRLAIKTFVKERSKKIIKNAIRQELARGGQVYYLHNRISTIDSALIKIEKLLAMPGIANRKKIAVAHAKLPDEQLIQIVEDFRNKKTDILVATTIIENGLDLSNVNTLIVEDASRLGLSQAHQIRGRIGRGERKAFAYFLYSRKKLTDTAKMRLETLKKYQGLGRGYEIAVQDLEIRGAGNLLGREQHGSINKVGLNLYVQMLNEAVEELSKAGV